MRTAHDDAVYDGGTRFNDNTLGEYGVFHRAVYLATLGNHRIFDNRARIKLLRRLCAVAVENTP